MSCQLEINFSREYTLGPNLINYKRFSKNRQDLKHTDETIYMKSKFLGEYVPIIINFKINATAVLITYEKLIICNSYLLHQIDYFFDYTNQIIK